MKVKDLFSAIAEGLKEYGKEFEEWDIAVEHHKNPKKCVNCKDSILKDSNDWEYIKCHGYNTYMPKEKVFTVNIHY